MQINSINTQINKKQNQNPNFGMKLSLNYSRLKNLKGTDTFNKILNAAQEIKGEIENLPPFRKSFEVSVPDDNRVFSANVYYKDRIFTELSAPEMTQKFSYVGEQMRKVSSMNISDIKKYLLDEASKASNAYYNDAVEHNRIIDTGVVNGKSIDLSDWSPEK